MDSQQDDSFFGPSSSSAATARAGGSGGAADPQSRARVMFGLPGDPTARRGIPTQFDADYDSYDESFSYIPHGGGNGGPQLMMGDVSHIDESLEYLHAAHQEASELQPPSSDAAYDAYDEEHSAVTDAMGADLTHEHDHGQQDRSSQQGDTTYPESDCSSVSPDEDPQAWAERLDEISGKLEMSEAEERALRWGPALGSQKDNPRLHWTDLRRVVDHHLKTTEWRFTGRTELDGQITAEEQPVRVVGRSWVGEEAGVRIEPLVALRQTLIESGYAAGP